MPGKRKTGGTLILKKTMKKRTDSGYLNTKKSLDQMKNSEINVFKKKCKNHTLNQGKIACYLESPTGARIADFHLFYESYSLKRPWNLRKLFHKI